MNIDIKKIKFINSLIENRDINRQNKVLLKKIKALTNNDLSVYKFLERSPCACIEGCSLYGIVHEKGDYSYNNLLPFYEQYIKRSIHNLWYFNFEH